MAIQGNRTSDESFFKIPAIKFTKLFINGEFVDSISGSVNLSVSFTANFLDVMTL